MVEGVGGQPQAVSGVVGVVGVRGGALVGGAGAPVHGRLVDLGHADAAGWRHVHLGSEQ